MNNKMLLLPLLAIIALPLMLSSTPTEASPPIRFRTVQQIKKDTDFVLRARILSRTVRVVGKTRTTRIRVKVYGVSARNGRARAHRVLRRGTVLEFSRSCGMYKLKPSEMWRTGYPNNRCGTGYSALPPSLMRAKGTKVKLRVKLVPRKGKATLYAIVATTFPATAGAVARRIK